MSESSLSDRVQAPPRITSEAVSSTTALPKARHTWIDATKGVAIVLVVLGHTLRGLFNAQIMASTGAWAFVDRAIYAFHMPLFFFLSGLFALPADHERFPDFARRRIVRLGYPYLLWATLQTLVQVVLSRYTNRPTTLADVWTIVYVPPMQFWFLYALLLQLLAIGLMRKLGASRTLIFGVGLALYLAGPYLSLGTWLPLYQARDALVYTGLGVLLGAPERLRMVDRQARGTYGAVAAIGLFAVVLGVHFQLEQHYLSALVIALLGTAGAIALCLLLERAHLAQAVHRHLLLLGTASLSIFVAHTLASAAVRIALQKVLHVDHAPVHMVLGMAAGLYGPLLLYLVSERANLPYLFAWPQKRG